ncbi:MAG: excinuclease ABC subunit UvrB [Oscillospiraceae bacterium]|jgi:excinuclease ABC subunit B|nr:excinuclease ABC subunit UvrB [Oscillospiraceae bacterium]
MERFKIHSEYSMNGDQQAAVTNLVKSLKAGCREQTLLGVTGSGKTFTIANVIAEINSPTLVLAHNKTLAAQLCCEFKEFFPENAVEYFVSYYDYYQPEAYIASTDTYIEKDNAINEEIERLRHSATAALAERRDVIIVSSVSCIYSLGNPLDYKNMVISLRPQMQKSRDELIQKLIEIQYERNDTEFVHNKFRVRGDVVDIFPVYESENAIRVQFFSDEIEKIQKINPLTGQVKLVMDHAAIYPASHYVIPREKLPPAIEKIQKEMQEQVKVFEAAGKLIEAQRIKERTNYDIELLREVGFCKGIENYSRVLAGREPGSAPFTLLDYLPEDFLMVIDESHVTLPQVRSMFAGDASRKNVLIEHGFRLPSARDNRPLSFDECYAKLHKIIFVSATPGDFEREKSAPNIFEQLIRPTGLLDPEVLVKPIEGQIADLLQLIRGRTSRNERTLVTTLTKKMAEDLTDYISKQGIKVKYMHSDIETLERTQILNSLRLGEIDVLVGINLLREGLDLPEVSLVAILDSDKEGFLRSKTSLIQTIGRAARNANGQVVMYADHVTESMRVAIDETNRRRAIQQKFNKENNITPQTIKKDVRETLEISRAEKEITSNFDGKKIKKKEKEKLIAELSREMKKAARALEFEHAAHLRDLINKLESNP